MSFSTGMALIITGCIAAYIVGVLVHSIRSRFKRRLTLDHATELKRRIAANGYRQSYNREYTL